MKKYTLNERLRYRFDNTLAKGPIALISWLFLLSAMAIVVISLVVAATGIAPAGDDGALPGFIQIAWMGLMRTLDAGTMGGDTGSWPFLLAMFAVTLAGVFVVSTLIGLLSSSIEGKIDELRQGRSLVVEDGHTVILGWSEQIFTLLSELVTANENQKRACIAVLADRDKVEMEADIRARLGHTGHTRIVCRTGSPIDMADLKIVNPQSARSIVILAPDSRDPDAQVIKTILALTHDGHAGSERIVAEIRKAQNFQVARMAGHGKVQLVLADDLISRIIVQTCCQSGLSVVYTELLDFAGDEIYFHEEPALAGRTFAEALLAFEDSAVLGIGRKDGAVQLNPPMDTRIEAGDQVIAISEDDDTILISGLKDYGIEADAIREPAACTAEPKRTLILGWNRQGPAIIRGLDAYAAPGSEVRVVTGVDGGPEDEAAYSDLRHESVSFEHHDITDRRLLDSLGVAGYSHIIVLSCSDHLGAQEADAQTLVTLLHLRDITERTHANLSIVSEMLDIQTRELAEVTRADDFIVSDKLVSLMLSQLAENRRLAPVFEDLFDPEGSELYLKPASDYVELGRPLNFYTIVEAARRRGEAAIGYRIKAQADDAARSYGVVVNPNKSERVTFAQGDRIIVLAEG